jgi:protein-disulfide isomerase
MSSRKEQKEQAKAKRLETEKSLKAEETKRRRIQIVGGMLVVAIIGIVIAIGAVSSGGSKLSKLTHNPQAQARVTSLLKGIPQSGTTLGNPKAKVTLGYFGDLQCPVCASFSSGTKYEGATSPGGLPQFITDQVRTGHAKLTYKSLCTATCSDYANGQQQFVEQQSAAYAAGEQGHFWDFGELFYREQGSEGSNYMNGSYLNSIAKEIPGFNYSKWQAARANDVSLLTRIKNEATQAQAEGANSTPSIFVTGPKGTTHLPAGVQSYAQLMTAVQKVE